MRLLDVINNILPYLGENPVTTEDPRHPTVALIIDNIKQQIDTLLGKGWWFNTRKATYRPNRDGSIIAPKDVITMYDLDPNKRTEMRRGYMYNMREGTFIFSEPVEMRVVEQLEFEDIPVYAQLVIQARAAISVYIKEFGVESAVEEIQKQETIAMNLLEQEHLRKMRYNSSKHSSATKRYLHALRG